MSERELHVSGPQDFKVGGITDKMRLDHLEAHPRHSEIVVDGIRTHCYFYGIAAAPGLSLRQAIDAVILKGEEKDSSQ